MIQLKNVTLYIIIICVFNSCCVFRKTKTETRIETVIKIDTIIRVQKDTVTLIKSVTLFDTAYIETDIAKAKSYYNPAKNKIVLELTGKSFNVPITVYKRTVEQKKVKDIIPVERNYLRYLFIMLIILVGVFLVWIKIYKK